MMGLQGHYCCRGKQIKRGLWCPEEDEKLFSYITTHGTGQWSSVPKKTGLQRCGKSCRLRWLNYLSPHVKKAPFSAEEVRIIKQQHRMLGNKWAQIAKKLPGRTDNDVKNFWNCYIKKRLALEEQGRALSLNIVPAVLSEPSDDLNNNNSCMLSFDGGANKGNCMDTVLEPTLQEQPSLALSLHDPPSEPQLPVDGTTDGASGFSSVSASTPGLTEEEQARIDQINEQMVRELEMVDDCSMSFDHGVVMDAWYWNVSLWKLN